LHAERAGHVSPTLKVFAVATALTVTALAAYLIVGWTNGSFTWTIFLVTIAIWLLVLGMLAIRAKVSPLWVALGAVVGLVLAPIIVFTALAITYAIFGWPELMD
jgi:hypothetical protein